MATGQVGVTAGAACRQSAEVSLAHAAAFHSAFAAKQPFQIWLQAKQASQQVQHLQSQLSSQQEQMQAAAGLQVELHTTRQSLNAVLQAEAEKAEELGAFRESHSASASSPLPRVLKRQRSSGCLSSATVV